MTVQTLRFAFPGKNTNFAIYSGSFELNDYTAWYISAANPRTTTLRISLYKTLDEAKAKHGVDARRVYSSMSNTAKSPFYSLIGSVRKFMGVERNRSEKFKGVQVPINVIDKTDTSVTLDIDLTGEEIFTKIKKSIWRPRAVSRPAGTKSTTTRAVAVNAVGNTSTSVKETTAPAQRSVELSKVKPTMQNASSITLSGELTLKDIKRMGFNLVFTDSADKPFIVDIK